MFGDGISNKDNSVIYPLREYKGFKIDIDTI